MRSPFFRLSALGVALLSVAAVGLLLNIPLNASAADLVRVDILVGLMMAATAIYFVTVRLVLQRAWPHQTIWMVIAVAVLLRALLLTARPFLSSDIYRYVWDGCVQAAGINPYRYEPADPALARLRDTAIYPNSNRVTYARTIYPPVAQMVFAAVGRIWDSVTGMRLLGFEALGIVCALNLLSLAGLPRERILIYAWNPLPLWAFASDGHVDAIVVGLLGAALLLRAASRRVGGSGGGRCRPRQVSPAGDGAGLPRDHDCHSAASCAGRRHTGALPRRRFAGSRCDDSHQSALLLVFRLAGAACRDCARACVVVAGDSSPAAGDRPDPARPVHLALARLRPRHPPAAGGSPPPAHDQIPAPRRIGRHRMSTTTALKDPRRYFEEIGADRSSVAEQPPVCLYLEVTNRCNLLCETCPRTFEELEPPADMSWELFTRIVDQIPNVARVVMHGVGEPMLVKNLPDMIRYLKARGTYVLFNTNGTLMQPKRFQELIDTGLDELRVSLDAADRESYAKIRGKDFFNRIVRDVGKFIAYQKQVGATTPRVSLWLTGLKETVDQLPEFVRLAARMGVTEVHLQRLVFDEVGYGKATADNSLFESAQEAERRGIEAAQEVALPLGVALDASGATEPGLSLKRQDDRAWAACRRPWSLMYFTAHGRALPCCIAPFSVRGYSNYTLGDATQQELREIWNSPAYRDFRSSLLSDAPPAPCQNCGMRWSL
jgi:MoaA/NifB/PqqE/SkfB family radical SAM enzyme